MSAPTTRVLCPRCFQSFPAATGPGTLCPECAEREVERAGRASSLPSVGAVVGTAPAAGIGATTADAGEPGDAAPEPLPDTLPGRIAHIFRREVRAAREWCDGRMPWFRIPLWFYLAWTFGRHLGSSEPYRSLFDGINLGIHELGHGIFRPLGTAMMIAGGTIAQLAAPIASLGIFRWQRDWFGMSVGLCWLATNLWGVSVYVGDARALELPLVSPGMGLMPGGDTSGMGGVIHDWNYLLGGPGLLKYDTTISAFVATLAVATMLAGLAFGAWLLARMLLSKEGQKIDWRVFR